MKKFITAVFVLMLTGVSAISAENNWDKITRGWSTMPIKVYLDNTGDKTKMIEAGFKTWEEKTSGKIRFKFVTKPHSGYANIVITTTDNFNDEKAGITHAQFGVNNIYKSSIEIGLKNAVSREKFTDDLLEIIIIHEIGHALGLNHSPDRKSVMYPYAILGQKIQQEDLDNLLKLY